MQGLRYGSQQHTVPGKGLANTPDLVGAHSRKVIAVPVTQSIVCPFVTKFRWITRLWLHCIQHPGFHLRKVPMWHMSWSGCLDAIRWLWVRKALLSLRVDQPLDW